MIKKALYSLLLILALSGNFSYSASHGYRVTMLQPVTDLYVALDLEAHGLKREIFEKALAGWSRMANSGLLGKQCVLSIADLSQSSNCRRLYIIDMENQQLLINTFVAHGRNSGEEFACSFGNKPQSYKSSLGFYLTGDTYQGAHGLSLRLRGCEKGFNDHAEERGIVIHGARYVSPTFIAQNGRLGRSQGCPAVPEELCPAIVDHIKNGSCFFVYYPDPQYMRCSELCR